MRFSVRDRAQNALFRRVRFSLPAQTWSHLTQRRILRRRSHVKAQSAPATARNGATVYTSAPKRHREAVFADLCTLLHTHGRSCDRAGATGPTTSRAHGPRDARAPGPEAHATGAVTQPPTHASSRSLIYYPRNNVRTLSMDPRRLMRGPPYRARIELSRRW